MSCQFLFFNHPYFCCISSISLKPTMFLQTSFWSIMMRGLTEVLSDCWSESLVRRCFHWGIQVGWVPLRSEKMRKKGWLFFVFEMLSVEKCIFGLLSWWFVWIFSRYTWFEGILYFRLVRYLYIIISLILILIPPPNLLLFFVIWVDSVVILWKDPNRLLLNSLNATR